MDNRQFLSHISQTYIAQMMEQFHVLIRLTTIVGNQYGYNFKSSRSSFSEPDLVSVKTAFCEIKKFQLN